MKKKLAFIMAAAMSISALSAFTANAAENAAKDFVLFGDSIAAGSSRDGKGVEYNYGDILADYYNGTASNFAVSGDDSDQMLEKIKNLSEDQKQAVKDAECVVISVGGNDIIYYTCQALLKYCANLNMLNDGYTIDNLPERPSLSQLKQIVKIDGTGGLREHLGNLNNAMNFVIEVREVSKQLRVDMPDKGYNCYIKNHIIKNISDAVAEIKAVNPNAQIVVQDIYQPLQIPKTFIDSNARLSTYSVAITQFRSIFEDIMSAFKKELTTQAESDGFTVADVLTDFTSQEEGVMKTDANPGHTSYFVDIAKSDILSADVHPNQKGHLAIAANIINVIGDTHNDNGVLSDIYENLADKADYPAVALAKYESAAGTWKLGDANFDGVIDGRDASTILSCYAVESIGKKGFTYRVRQASEINGDGVADGNDATLLLTYYAKASAGKVGAFEDFIKENK